MISFCTKFEYNTKKSGFWGKLPLFNVTTVTLQNSFNLYNFWHFLTVMQKQCWPKVRKLKNRARHYNLAKSWLDASLERHLRHGHLRQISINSLFDLYGKMISDKQRAKHVYTVLEMGKQHFVQNHFVQYWLVQIIYVHHEFGQLYYVPHNVWPNTFRPKHFSPWPTWSNTFLSKRKTGLTCECFYEDDIQLQIQAALGCSMYYCKECNIGLKCLD